MSIIEIDTTVKSGLPVIAIMDYEPKDPSVGWMNDSVSEPWIHWLSGKEVTKAVYDSIPKSDIDRIMTEGLESMQDVRQY